MDGLSRAPGILHADLDSFYASVEQRDDARLRGHPLIVGSWVVLAASYEAKAFGVRSAMPTRRALRLCPQALVVEPRMEAYVEASRAVFEVFRSTTPIVEALSIDEAFLEVGGLRRSTGDARAVATRLREEVRASVGLPITVGAATTKHLAKVASALAKPDGLLVVEPGDELELLHGLAVERLWGVGPKTASALRARGIATVGQVAAMDLTSLAVAVGDGAAHHLKDLAANRDPRPVEGGRTRKSVGAQRALHHPVASFRELAAMLDSLVDEVAWRLRKADRAGRTVTLRLRLADYSRRSRARTLPTGATSATEVIRTAARELLAGSEELTRRGVTLVGVAVSNLEERAGDQLGLALDGERGDALDRALDEVRGRFGGAALARASSVRHHQMTTSTTSRTPS